MPGAPGRAASPPPPTLSPLPGVLLSSVCVLSAGQSCRHYESSLVVAKPGPCSTPVWFPAGQAPSFQVERKRKRNSVLSTWPARLESRKPCVCRPSIYHLFINVFIYHLHLPSYLSTIYLSMYQPYLSIYHLSICQYQPINVSSINVSLSVSLSNLSVHPSIHPSVL